MPRSSTTCRTSERGQQPQQQELTAAATITTTKTTASDTSSSASSSSRTTTATTTSTTAGSLTTAEQQQAVLDGGGNNNNNNNTNNNNNIKKELAAAATASAVATAAVPHRKSERRRVARDIFLVFEEQPSRRRGRGAKGRQTRTKRKFGHLKVQQPSSCLLRDIKTEPKCVLNGDLAEAAVAVEKEPLALPPAATIAAQPITVATVHPAVPPLMTTVATGAKVKIETKTCAAAAVAVAVAAAATPPTPPPSTPAPSTPQPPASAPAPAPKSTAPKPTTTTATVKTVSAAPEVTASNETTPMSRATPSVNPIFLWVKQDDTRIVEVRCEDYDKRNRIRLTKTTNGWRSMPRTDASSTRIVKFFQSGSPLMKVKREVYESQHHPEEQQQDEHEHEQEQDQLEMEQQTREDEHDDEEEQHQLELAPSTPLEEKVVPTWHETAMDAPPTPTPTPTHTTIVDNVVLVTGAEASCTHTMSSSSASLEQQLSSSSASSAANLSFDALLDNATMASSKIKHTPTYQGSRSRSSTPSTMPMELQLCPKTGLFLPKHGAAQHAQAPLTASTCEIDNATEANSVCMMTKQLLETDKTELSTVDNTVESLDANTKNLKDLIDDVDLLQHCSSDNNGNGAELLDSLVKRSCEESLVQDSTAATTTTAMSAAAEALMKDALSLTTFCVTDLNELTAKDLPPIMNMVDDTPKCLSFNEAGEIEGLNGELFQGHNFIDSFVKEPNMSTVSSGSATAPVVVDDVEPELDLEPSPIDLEQSPQEKPQETEPLAVSPAAEVAVPEEVTSQPEKLHDDAPKDLSYKKREEVCPPSESRSQCAVTSSSDILKSPEHDAGALHAEVETTSETIKNLILEQFIKLNALNQLPATPTAAVASAAAVQQAEPMDLGKCRVQVSAGSDGSGSVVGGVGHQPLLPVAAAKVTNSAARGNYLETVVIDEDEEEEPLKKRHCTASANKSNIKLDKDPDPLTQLKMLLTNGQWKVPDPILVPKERLGAVLASPAREIPLLLTTRPELRLPEAFGYPEIIQNPNILVISMAQLKAILESELMTHSKATHAQAMPAEDMVNSKLQCNKELHKPPTVVSLPLEPRANPNHNNNSSAAVAAATAVGNKCAVHTPQPPPDSSVDINAATLAMLQQMLWLPYFGQLSQEFFKTLKDPLGLQRKYANQLMPPFYNNNQFGLQHLDELYKHYMKHMSVAGTPKQVATPTPPPPPLPTKLQPTPPPTLQPSPAVAGVVPPVAAAAAAAGFGAYPNPLELAIFQKLCQPQMPNILSMNAAAVAAAAAAAANQQCEPQSPASTPTTAKHLAEHQQQQRARRSEANGLELLNIPDFNSNFNPLEKSSVGSKHTPTEHKKPAMTLTATAGAPPTPAATPTTPTAPPPAEHKPRLTCKSLSNLLDPEVVPTLPLLNVPYDSMRRSQCNKAAAAAAAATESNTRQLRSHKATVTFNGLEHVKQLHPNASQPTLQQRKRGMHDHHHHGSHGGVAAAASSAAAGMEAAMRGADPNSAMDANAALWHPLFGSNPKQGYNSPWQWTTVTATGE